MVLVCPTSVKYGLKPFVTFWKVSTTCYTSSAFSPWFPFMYYFRRAIDSPYESPFTSKKLFGYISPTIVPCISRICQDLTTTVASTTTENMVEKSELPGAWKINWKWWHNFSTVLDISILMKGEILFSTNSLHVCLSDTKPRFTATDSYPLLLPLAAKSRYKLSVPVANCGLGFPLIFTYRHAKDCIWDLPKIINCCDIVDWTQT